VLEDTQDSVQSISLLFTGEGNADDASVVIVKEFWERLRGELPRVH